MLMLEPQNIIIYEYITYDVIYEVYNYRNESGEL